MSTPQTEPNTGLLGDQARFCAGLAAAGAALGALYVSPWTAADILAFVAYVAVAFRSPVSAGVWVLWTAPWYRFPKVWDAAALGPVAAGRTAPVEIAVVEIALAGAVAGWAARRAWDWWREDGAFGRSPSPRGMLAVLTSPPSLLVAVALVSLPFTEHLHVALREFRTVILGPAVYALMLLDVLRRPEDRRRYVRAMVALAAWVGVQGEVRYITRAEVTEAEGVLRAAAIYWSPNHLALLLDRLLPLVAALALFGRPRDWWWRAAVLAAVTGSVTLALTFSRAGWLAVGFVTVGALALRKSRRAALAVATVLVAAGACAALLAPPERLLSASTSSQRLWVWQASLAMLRDHPLTGVGLDNFLYAYQDYRLPEAWREPDLSHPHNLFLDFWLRLGILGTAWLAAFAVSFLRVSLGAYAAAGSPWQRAAVTGVAASMAASALHGLVDNSFFLIDLAYVTLALWALQERFAQPASPAVGDG